MQQFPENPSYLFLLHPGLMEFIRDLNMMRLPLLMRTLISLMYWIFLLLMEMPRVLLFIRMAVLWSIILLSHGGMCIISSVFWERIPICLKKRSISFRKSLKQDVPMRCWWIWMEGATIWSMKNQISRTGCFWDLSRRILSMPVWIACSVVQCFLLAWSCSVLPPFLSSLLFKKAGQVSGEKIQRSCTGMSCFKSCQWMWMMFSWCWMPKHMRQIMSARMWKNCWDLR